jgi:D-alanine--poly(phosphoribitol) ligase subunit 1
MGAGVSGKTTPIFSYFQKVCYTNPDDNALIYSNDENYTYYDLYRASLEFATFIDNLELNTGDVLLIAGDKDVRMFASILACLKHGVIYSIIDPDMPKNRLLSIVEACKPRFIFGPIKAIQDSPSKDKYRNLVWEQLPSVLKRSTFLEDLSKNTEYFCVKENDACYIVFTSGSTGKPKGPVMSYSGVINFIEWTRAQFKYKPGDRLTGLNPAYFDNFVFDFYASFFSGAAIVVFDKNELRNPFAVIKKIDKLFCNSWFSVPTTLIYFNAMSAITNQSLRYIDKIIFGGEGYPKKKLKDLYDMFSDRIIFFNVYGPSECTCICSLHKVTDKDFEDFESYLPLGNMISNFDYMILDEKGSQLDDDQIGELFLMGQGVGLGYFGSEELTRKSFVFKKKGFETYRGYLTGDMVSKNSNQLRIHGRKDNQIKHMGYRIELEEIENILSKHDAIEQVACIYVKDNDVGLIVAYIKVKRKFDLSQLRKEIRIILPSYMMPGRIELLEKLPTNANGKIDRRHLKDNYLEKQHN